MLKNLQSISFRLILSIAVFLIVPFKYSLANDYSQGFAAFVNGDYVQAQKLWLKAADNGDVKSMFNLGLLHEQSKLPASNSEKAEDWYRKAANNGYSAASYHLAQRLFERGGSDDEAIAMINSAAEQGYAPALRYIGSGPKANSDQVLSQANSLSQTNSLKEVSAYQVESWINQQQKGHWTVQLLAFTEESKVQEFITEHDLQKKAAYFVEKKDGVVWYKLIFGSFSTKDKATFARQNLSAQLQEYGPWLRTIASVQAITKG